MQTENPSVIGRGLLQRTRSDTSEELWDELLEEISTDQQHHLSIQSFQKGNTTMSDNILRTLIRYLQPLAKLREDSERAIHMDLFESTGEAAVRTYQGLYTVISKTVTDDPYLDSLALEISSDASEREKMNLVNMLSGQLLAFVQGYVGISAFGNASHTSIQTAPHININNITDGGKDLLKSVNRMLEEDEDGEDE